MSFNPSFETNRFKKISINAFVDKYKKSNPGADTGELKKNLTNFKKLKSKGETCSCGNPIWIIGSAIAGQGCFTCITGESYSENDYEIK